MKSSFRFLTILAILSVLLLFSFFSCKNSLQEIIGIDVVSKNIILKLGTEVIANRDGECTFGEVEVGSEKNLEITIENKGNSELSLTGEPLVSIENIDGSEFEVTSLPETTIAPGQSGSFIVTFAPTREGEQSAIVEIQNSFTNNSYTFSLTGTGIAPEIVITAESTNISIGDTFSFGSVSSTIGKSVVFSISNTGSANLHLTGNPKVEFSEGPSEEWIFHIPSQPTSPIMPMGNKDFTIQFSPFPADIPYSVKVTIENNDPDESSFQFTVTGIGFEDV